MIKCPLFRGTFHRYIWLDNVYNCSLKTKDGILVFVKYLKIFPKKMTLSVPHHVWIRLRICNSSCSWIADLVFSSALLTPKTTEKFKINCFAAFLFHLLYVVLVCFFVLYTNWITGRTFTSKMILTMFLCWVVFGVMLYHVVLAWTYFFLHSI